MTVQNSIAEAILDSSGGGKGLLSSSLRNIKALLIYETGSLGSVGKPEVACVGQSGAAAILSGGTAEGMR